MDDKIINVLIITLVSFVCLSDLMVPEDVTGFPLTAPGNFSCVNQLTNGNFTLATNCTNGRGLIGCCVDRAHCGYNTSNIDLTMYAPRGFKGSCFNMHVCCPLQYVMPVILTNYTSEDNDVDKDDMNDDDDF